MKKGKNPQVFDLCDEGKVASTTDCTGIIATAPESEESYNEVMNTVNFSPKNASVSNSKKSKPK